MTMVQIDFGADFEPVMPSAAWTPVQWAGLGLFCLGAVLCVCGRSLMVGNGIGAQEFGL